MVAERKRRQAVEPTRGNLGFSAQQTDNINIAGNHLQSGWLTTNRTACGPAKSTTMNTEAVSLEKLEGQF